MIASDPQFRRGGRELTAESIEAEGAVRDEFEAAGVAFHEADLDAHREATAGFWEGAEGWPEGLFEEIRAAATGG